MPSQVGASALYIAREKGGLIKIDTICHVAVQIYQKTLNNLAMYMGVLYVLQVGCHCRLIQVFPCFVDLIRLNTNS